MLVIAAPGQGAQAPGFLAPWLDLPGFADRVAAWSDLAGCDLISCGTTAGAEEITDTAIAQPLLVAAAIAAAERVFGALDQARKQAVIAAGHSVGELAAGAIAGRSEEHTSELQSRVDLVCRLLLEKKKTAVQVRPRVVGQRE